MCQKCRISGVTMLQCVVFSDVIVTYATSGSSAAGSARGLGPRGRRFEPCLPDHRKAILRGWFFYGRKMARICDVLVQPKQSRRFGAVNKGSESLLSTLCERRSPPLAGDTLSQTGNIFFITGTFINPKMSSSTPTPIAPFTQKFSLTGMKVTTKQSTTACKQ